MAFPNPHWGDPDGLLAIGGDLSVDRLILAYSNGIFPWFPVGFFDLAFEDVQQYDIDGVTVTQRQNAGRITGISWTREGYEYLLYSLQPEMNMIAGLAVEFVTNTRAEAVV